MLFLYRYVTIKMEYDVKEKRRKANNGVEIKENKYRTMKC
jgi:hypothetical protein